MRKVTDDFNFYQGNDPRELVEKFGSPLYVYNENIFRERCREMTDLSSYPKFAVNYAVKANPNLSLLKIAREEGIGVDASSQGEAVAAMAAGYKPDEIMFIVNNVSADELAFAAKNNFTVSVDSLSQLDTFGHVCPGGKITLRFNSGIGGGHHEKVVTGGDGTKFGIMPEYIPDVKELLHRHNLKLIGINHHIGSQNRGDLYIDGVNALLKLARQFDDLEFIDFGGGFATPYHKQNGERPLDLRVIGKMIDSLLFEFAEDYGRELVFMVEPGRFLTAECSVLLGTINAVKSCGTKKYAGTDMGFSVLKRPTVYDAHHDIEIYRANGKPDYSSLQKISVVGNQCETGDYIAKERELPALIEGDIIGVLDAGAYGYAMSCNYNLRTRPAEIL
ncbi:MAG: diaminopimelate decarboxylase, partial [Clostridiales bacterium]|nr:diaminopimelate decarboxylase [Clostridiales bacterium]